MMTEAEMGLRGLLGLSGGGGGWHGGWGGRRHYGGGWWGPGSWYWGGASPLVVQVPDPTAQLQAQQALQTATQALVAAETPWYSKIPWWGWLAIAGGAYMILKPKRVANRRRRNGSWNYDDIRDSDGKTVMLRFLPYLDTAHLIGYTPKLRGYGYGRWEEFFHSVPEAQARMRFLASAGAIEDAEIYKALPPGAGLKMKLVDEWKVEETEADPVANRRRRNGNRWGLKVGQHVQLGDLYLKRVKATEFFLRQPDGRVRWGTADQVAEDIAYYDEVGALPRSKTNWY